jgi:hypothetical protein
MSSLQTEKLSLLASWGGARAFRTAAFELSRCFSPRCVFRYQFSVANAKGEARRGGNALVELTGPCRRQAPLDSHVNSEAFDLESMNLHLAPALQMLSQALGQRHDLAKSPALMFPPNLTFPDARRLP